MHCFCKTKLSALFFSVQSLCDLYFMNVYECILYSSDFHKMERLFDYLKNY